MDLWSYVEWVLVEKDFLLGVKSVSYRENFFIPQLFLAPDYFVLNEIMGTQQLLWGGEILSL